MPGLARQRGGYRFDVDQRLTTESSADLHGNRPDLGHRHIDEARRLITHIEVPLTARPDGESAIIVPHGRGRMRLDIALMNRGRKGFVLHDDVRFLEALVDITQAK